MKWKQDATVREEKHALTKPNHAQDSSATVNATTTYHSYRGEEMPEPIANDIQEFRFTHLEMAIIGVGVDMLRDSVKELHTMSHAVLGECDPGTKTLFTAAKSIINQLNSKVDPRITEQIIANAMNGKFPS